MRKFADIKVRWTDTNHDESSILIDFTSTNQVQNFDDLKNFAIYFVKSRNISLLGKAGIHFSSVFGSSIF